METTTTLNYSWEVIKIFFYLGVVILLIYLLNHFLRNYRKYFRREGTVLKVIDRGFLTQNAQVAIIQVKGKYYLIGITDEKITVIDTFDTLDDIEPTQQRPKKMSPLNFAEILKGAFRKKDGGDE